MRTAVNCSNVELLKLEGLSVYAVNMKKVVYCTCSTVVIDSTALTAEVRMSAASWADVDCSPTACAAYVTNIQKPRSMPAAHSPGAVPEWGVASRAICAPEWGGVVSRAIWAPASAPS